MNAKADWKKKEETEKEHLNESYFGAGTEVHANNPLQYIWAGYVTVKNGSKLLVHHSDLRTEIISGPCSIFLKQVYYQLLSCVQAGPQKYLNIKYMDGRREHLAGPTSIWWIPHEHLSFYICPAITLEKDQALVMYSPAGPQVVQQATGVSDEIPRKIIIGPGCVVPGPFDWPHTFIWQQTNRFHKLKLIPDTFDINIDLVRTKDDALLDLHLRIVFQLLEIEKMLETTQDPITDLTSSVNSDIVIFVASLSFEQFKASSESFSDLKSYPQLLATAKEIGFAIHKIVFKGYQSGEALQKMQTEGIQARKKLEWEFETEQQQQKIKDMQLENEEQRIKIKQDAQRTRILHYLKMSKQQQTEELESLKELKQFGVDLTSFLVSKYEEEKKKKK